MSAFLGTNTSVQVDGNGSIFPAICGVNSIILPVIGYDALQRRIQMRQLDVGEPGEVQWLAIDEGVYGLECC